MGSLELHNVKVCKWIPFLFNFEKSSLYVKDMNEDSVDFNSVGYIKLHDTTACVTQQPKVNLIKAMVEELEEYIIRTLRMLKDDTEKQSTEPHKKKWEPKTKISL